MMCACRWRKVLSWVEAVCLSNRHSEQIADSLAKNKCLALEPRFGYMRTGLRSTLQPGHIISGTYFGFEILLKMQLPTSYTPFSLAKYLSCERMNPLNGLFGS